MSSNEPDLDLILNHPSFLKTIPAGFPPPNVQANFEHPYTRLPVISGVGVPLVVLAISCFTLRIYTKLAIIKLWKWDDLTCGLGLLISIVYFAAFLMGCIDGSACKHIWDIHVDKIFNEHAIQQNYIDIVLMTPALGLIKCSFFIQYYQLFRPFRWVRISVTIGATISTIFFTTISIIVLVLATPRSGQSLTEAAVTKKFFNFKTMSIFNGVFGILVDWCLLILPIPAVWSLEMPTAKKLGLLVIFMTGSLAAVASIVSFHIRILLENDTSVNSDPFWKESSLLLWVTVEMFAGITASCMPTVHKFFSHHNISLASYLSSWKSSLKRSPGSTRQEKLLDDALGTGDSGGITKPGLRSEEFELREGEIAHPENLHIRVTRNVSVERVQSVDGRS